MKKYRVDEDGDIIMTTNGCDCYIDIEDLETHLNSMVRETEKCYSEIAHKETIISEEFTKEEFDLFRQWFNAVQDLNEPYLEKADYELMEKVKSKLI